MKDTHNMMTLGILSVVANKRNKLPVMRLANDEKKKGGGGYGYGLETIAAFVETGVADMY